MVRFQCMVGTNSQSLRAVSAGPRSASRVESLQSLEVFEQLPNGLEML